LPKFQKGVALVEFALILPLLLILTFITTEYARAMYEYNSLAKSVRNAARYLSTKGYGPTGCLTTKLAYHITATNIAVYGNPAASGQPLARGLSPSNISAGDICYATTTTSVPTIRTVTIRISGYTFQSLFTSVTGLRWGNFTFGNINFEDIAATMRVMT